MTVVLTIIAAILIFAVMIFIHELGHFMAAKACKVKVREFAIGMGPKLWGKQKGETLYSLRAIPLGGFCAMEGEGETSDDPRSFSRRPAWMRLIILAAGAAMNILLGFLLLLVISGTQPQYTSTTVSSVTEGSPAAVAGLQPGDTIKKFNDKKIRIYRDIMFQSPRHGLNESTFEIDRGGERIMLQITPENQNGSPMYGFRPAAKDNSVIMTFRNAWYETGFYSKVIITTVFDLFRGQVSVADLSGPIGIVSEINNAVTQSVHHGWEGFLSVLYLAVLLTINLGIFNLLPIPALDGGHILFVLVELVRRKALPPEKEGLVHMIGFAALILLSIFIAFQDVFRIWF